MAVQTVSLRGPDHPRLGAISACGIGSVGLAISAGQIADPAAHLDPNEDALLAAVGPGGAFVGVIDGCGGFDAAAAALQELDAAAPSLVDRPAGGPALLERVDAVRRRAGGVRREDARAHASSASFSLVLFDGDAGFACTRGDTGVALLGPPTTVVSGVVPHLDHAAPPAPLQQFELSAGRRLLLASDGFFDALGPQWVPEARAAGALDPTAAARRLVSVACREGADDNVSVAVADVQQPRI